MALIADAAIPDVPLVPRQAPPPTEPRDADLGQTARETLRPRAPPRLEVGFITPNLLIGGVEHWLLGLVRHSAQRLQWSVAVTQPSAVEPEMRARVEEFASVDIGDGAALALSRACDALVCWGIADLGRYSRGFPGPVVVVSHGCCDWTRHFIAASRGAATHFAAVSHAAASPFDDQRVEVIPNGVDAARCRAIRPREEVRREWGLCADEVAVGFVGRFSPEKNPLALSRAVRALGPRFRAVYVGRGYGVDLRSEALRLTHDAIFVPPMHQIGDALRALDCLIMASPSEGYSMVLAEALWCGLPVVSTPVGLALELQREHGLELVTVPVNPSAEQLAAAVPTAMSAANRPLIQRAQAIIRQHYTAEAMAHRWADYLWSITGR
jgi:glycosyltransferase involved in cell wall biosynthesis